MKQHETLRHDESNNVAKSTDVEQDGSSVGNEDFLERGQERRLKYRVKEQAYSHMR